MLIQSVTVNRVGKNIDKIVTSYGRFKGTKITLEQFYQKGKQIERHMRIIKPNYIRNNVKVRNSDGKFDTWG